MDVGERPLDEAESMASNSYYVHGLCIYGARWDPEQKTIVDLPTNTADPGREFPMLHLTIDRVDPAAGRGDEDSDGTQIFAVTPGLQRKSKLVSRSIYKCPMYVNFRKNRAANNAGAEGQVITHVPIPLRNGESPGFWSKRSVSLVSEVGDSSYNF